MRADLHNVMSEIQGEQHTPALIDKLSVFASKHGFSSMMIGHLVNPLSHPQSNRFLIHNCPSEMMARLQRSSAFFYDQVFSKMLRSTSPFSWTSVHPDARAQPQTMLAIVREFGFQEGYSFPTQGRNGTLGGISLCGDARVRTPRTLNWMHRVFYAAFHRLEILEGPFVYEQYPELSPLERAALQCAAGGKGVSETAIILGVPSVSAKDALKRARRKLGANSTAQAVAAAVGARLMV
jgi:LuxR family transcriptional regulator, quorum-sensing system regulator BjaR1